MDSLLSCWLPPPEEGEDEEDPLREGDAQQQTSASSPLQLVDLDDNLLLSILNHFSTSAASRISMTCKAFHSLASDGRLWRAALSERHFEIGAERWTLAQWGFEGVPQGYRCVLQAVEALKQWIGGGYFVLLSDHPWCQLLEMRLENARLLAYAQRIKISPNGEVQIQDDKLPLFSIAFEAHRGGALRMVASVSSTNRPGVVSNTIPSTAPGDIRAAVASTPFPPPVPYSFLTAVHSRRDVLRIAWQPRERATTGEYDPMITATDRLPVPPLSSDWVVRNIEQRWRLARRSPLANDPKRAMSAALVICRPPIAAAGTEAARWPMGMDEANLPPLGLYCANYGGPDERNTQVIALRLERFRSGDLSDGAALRALQLQSESSSKTGTCALVATKILGDLHVPAGATAFYVPLKFKGGKSGRGVLVEPLPDDEMDSPPHHQEVGTQQAFKSIWRGHGCCANVGFVSPVFNEGRLNVLDEKRASSSSSSPAGGPSFTFQFLAPGMPPHVYYRLPSRGRGFGAE